jgi:hypothetical protein
MSKLSVSIIAQLKSASLVIPNRFEMAFPQIADKRLIY